MPQNTEVLRAFLKELNERRDTYIEKAPPLARKLYGREKGPKVFNESSFLYIRSYEGDIGVRPIGNVNFWNSPDISLTAATGTAPLSTNTINAGETYTLRCQLHNRGDVMVPYPKVEFFLTTPTLGFDVRYASQLGATQMYGLLLPNTNGAAELSYSVPATESGHKCLFARTFSFSPLDKPYDIYALDPRLDRHIGQKNLNIVGQSTTYAFNLIHLPNADENIAFIQLGANEILALGEPLLARFNWRERFDGTPFNEAKIEITDTENKISISQGKQGINVNSAGKGATAKQQATLKRSVNRASTQINAGKAKYSRFKELFQAHGKMNDLVQKTSFQMHIPDLGLKPGEAAAWNIVNTNNITKEVKGGITLIVTG